MSHTLPDATTAQLPLEPQAMQMLMLMVAPEAFLRPERDGAVVYDKRTGITLARGRYSLRFVEILLAHRCLKGSGVLSRREYRLSDVGRRAALRVLNGEQPTLPSTSHMQLTLQVSPEAGPAVMVNEAESPLLWLRRRRGRDGQSLISDVEFAAGERLRTDIDRAQMLPRVTAVWDRPPAEGASGSAGLNLTETVLAAKQRVESALVAVGPEFSGLLIDVCGFLKSIETVEQERGWPARSAKVVLCLGLQRLARHYGYANEARGRTRGQMQSWMGEAARPAFSAAAQSA